MLVTPAEILTALVACSLYSGAVAIPIKDDCQNRDCCSKFFHITSASNGSSSSPSKQVLSLTERRKFGLRSEFGP